jgi:hypothetical protein
VKLTFETSLRNAFEKNSQRIQDIATAVRLYTEYSDSIIVKFLESFDIYLRMGRVEISTSTLSTLWRGVLPPELELDFASDQALEKLRVLAQIPIPRDLDYARTRIATMNVLLMDNAIKEGLPHLTTKRYTRSVYATAESLLSDLLNREIESQIGILENILIEPEKQLENLKTEGVGS